MSSLSIVELGARVDALSARAEVESRAVSTTFTDMRSYVSESVATLRRDMVRRFDAVDKRFDAVDMRFGRLEKRFDGLEKRFDGLEKRFDRLEQRFDGLEQRFGQLELRVGALEKRFDGLEKRFDGIEKRFDGLEKRVADDVGGATVPIVAGGMGGLEQGFSLARIAALHFRRAGLSVG